MVMLNLFCQKCECKGLTSIPSMSNSIKIFAVCDNCGETYWIPIKEAKRTKYTLPQKKDNHGSQS